MTKTRKNFAFDSDLINKSEMRAAQSKRSLTKHIEMLLEADLKKHERDFFSYLNKRNKNVR